jgi:hypothetical protein
MAKVEMQCRLKHRYVFLPPPAVHSVLNIINSNFYIVGDKITTIQEVLRFYSYASSRQTYVIRIRSVKNNTIGDYGS